jgi:hypothetical protein
MLRSARSSADPFFIAGRPTYLLSSPPQTGISAPTSYAGLGESIGHRTAAISVSYTPFAPLPTSFVLSEPDPAVLEQPLSDSARASPHAGRRESTALRCDALAVGLRGAQELITLPLARAALAFIETKGWTVHGYSRLDDHARERFGRSGRWVRDLAALGRMFSTLPGLARAMTGEDGGRPLGRVAGLLVGSIAAEGSLPAWVAFARRLSVRELKDEIARARKVGSPWPIGFARGPVRTDPRFCGRRRKPMVD